MLLCILQWLHLAHFTIKYLQTDWSALLLSSVLVLLFYVIVVPPCTFHHKHLVFSPKVDPGINKTKLFPSNLALRSAHWGEPETRCSTVAIIFSFCTLQIVGTSTWSLGTKNKVVLGKKLFNCHSGFARSDNYLCLSMPSDKNMTTPVSKIKSLADFVKQLGVNSPVDSKSGGILKLSLLLRCLFGCLCQNLSHNLQTRGQIVSHILHFYWHLPSHSGIPFSVLSLLANQL